MTHRPSLSGCLAALLFAGAAAADSNVPGQKLDSGLGELPPYARWADKTGRTPVRVAVPGESLDSGLGELPHFRFWKDPTGKDPLGTVALRSDPPRR